MCTYESHAPADVMKARLLNAPLVTRCHSYVTAGMIDFLPDTTAHELRGKHPLPDWPYRE
jgi:hypothetical protein